MIKVVKGPLSYADIRIVHNIAYPTFREASIMSSFLANDYEFIKASKEAND